MITNLQTRLSVPYYFREVARQEIKMKQYNPIGGWDFDWAKPITHSFDVYGLVTDEFANDVQGLIALKPNYDDDYRCVDVEIIESTPSNRKMLNGKPNPNRRYKGIGKCLVAFACQYSVNRELEGFVQLTSKSSKLDFYRDMGGIITYGQNVMFSDEAALKLCKQYFARGIPWWDERGTL